MQAQWQDRRDAAFRGVPFLLNTVRGKTGRRTVPHEYPKSNLGWPEDNGGALNVETIKAVLVGPTAQTQCQQLLDALNVAGPGELVHPYWGIRQVQVGDVNYDFDNNERDICRLSFQIFAVSDRLFPADQLDTQQAVTEQARAANDAQCERFAQVTEALTPEQATSMADHLDGLLDSLDNTVNNLPGLPEQTGEWVNRLGRVKSSVTRGLTYPGQQARDITDLLFRVKDLVTELPLSLSIYDQLAQRWQGEREALNPTRSATTPEQAQQLTALDLMLTAVVTGKANAIANGELTDSQQAEQAATSMTTSLATQAARAVEDGNRDGWRTLRALRLSVVEDIKTRARQLPRMRTVSIERPIPSALLAYHITGDAQQRDDIVKRNRLSRPAFVTGNVDVLENSNG
ncbi:DNA circularization N-terminal domain-containing protein [Enterovibrio sp. Hal110]